MNIKRWSFVFRTFSVAMFIAAYLLIDGILFGGMPFWTVAALLPATLWLGFRSLAFSTQLQRYRRAKIAAKQRKMWQQTNYAKNMQNEVIIVQSVGATHTGRAA